MKRVYWLLIAAVPVVLWWLSQGGSPQESQPAAPAQPAPEPQPKEEAPPEPARGAPAATNGAFHKPVPSEVAPEPAEESPAPSESSPAAPEEVEQAAETAPPETPQIEVSPVPAQPEPESPPQGEKIQLFDSKDRSLEASLLEISSGQARVACGETLPDKEKVRLVLPFGAEAITVNGQLLGQEQGVARFKIMTMKAGQKKRFEEYLAQRS